MSKRALVIYLDEEMLQLLDSLVAVNKEVVAATDKSLSTFLPTTRAAFTREFIERSFARKSAEEYKSRLLSVLKPSSM